MIDTLSPNAEFWLALASAVVVLILAWGKMTWDVGRLKKTLNGPFDRLQATVASMDKKLDVIAERQNNRDREVENVRQSVETERKDRESAIRRVYQKIDTGRYQAEAD